MNPTKMAVSAFFAGGLLAVGAVLQPFLWTYWLAYLFLAALLMGVDIIMAPRLDRLSVVLDGPKQLYVGAAHRGELIFANPGRRAHVVRLKVDVSENLKEVPELSRLTLHAGETRVGLPLQAFRRGW